MDTKATHASNETARVEPAVGSTIPITIIAYSHEEARQVSAEMGVVPARILSVAAGDLPRAVGVLWRGQVAVLTPYAALTLTEADRIALHNMLATLSMSKPRMTRTRRRSRRVLGLAV